LQSGISDLRRQAEQLKADREKLEAERQKGVPSADHGDSAQTAEMMKMRLRLAQLLAKLSKRDQEPRRPLGKSATDAGTAPPLVSPRVPGEALVPSRPSEGTGSAGTDKLVDPLALAQALFKSGDFEGALAAYRLLDASKLSRREHAAAQYMTACCLRHLGKTAEAASLYREVANAREDDFLAECAQWQLGAIQWRQEMESQLQQLRKRRLALEVKP
jgi:hypothetical protein